MALNTEEVHNAGQAEETFVSKGKPAKTKSGKSRSPSAKGKGGSPKGKKGKGGKEETTPAPGNSLQRMILLRRLFFFYLKNHLFDKSLFNNKSLKIINLI